MATHFSEGVLFPDFDSLITNTRLSDECDNTIISKHRRQIERFRNLDLLKGLLGPEGYKPIMLKAVKDIVPTNLVAFSKAAKKKSWKSIVHFFEYDYVLERFWNCPKRYLRMLKRHKAVIGPDFSVECSLPEEVNEWHLFVNRALSYIMQTYGIVVIPNLSICPVSLYDKMFNCLEHGGIYAVSSVRANGDYFSRHEWYKFVREAINRLSPQALIVYGNKMPVSEVKVYYFENENLINLRNGKEPAA